MKVKLTDSEKLEAVDQDVSKIKSLEIPEIDERKDKDGIFVDHGVVKVVLDLFIVRRSNYTNIIIATLNDYDPFEYDLYLLPQDYIDWAEFVNESQEDLDDTFLPLAVEFGKRKSDGKYIVDVKQG